MNQTQAPYSGYRSASEPYAGQAPYYVPGQPNVYQPDPYAPASPYGLADETPPPPAGKPARKVRTTLGRAQGQKQRRRPIVAVDPNARMVSAFRPGALPGGNVRVLDEPPAPIQTTLVRRPASLAYLRPLTAREHWAYRLLFSTVALAFCAAFLLGSLLFWAPAGTGADQHAQLVAGRLLAEQGTVVLAPTEPFAFVGEGWIATGEIKLTDAGAAVQEYVPRHPLGPAFLYAGLFRLAPDAEQGFVWAHLVTPISAALAVLATFFLGRFAGGSFLGALAMLAMAAGVLLLQPSAADALSLALAIWGFVLLLAWWRSGNVVTGITAGLLLGACATVSYANVLLVAPLVMACAFAWQWRRPFMSLLRVIVPIMAFVLPVAGLLYFNHRTFGAWTALHVTGELALLDADNILHNWPSLLSRAGGGGLIFLLPLGLVGLLALCARRLPLGLVLLAWFVLPIVAYAAYAFASTETGTLPFLLTVSPVLLFGGAYLLRRVLYAPSDAGPQLIEAEDPNTGELVYMLADPPTPFWRSLAAPVAAGLVVAAGLGLGAGDLSGGRPDSLQARHHERANLAALGALTRATVPAEAVLIVDVPVAAAGALRDLDVDGRYHLFDPEAFSPRNARRFASPWTPAAEDGGPQPLDRRRYEFLKAHYEAMDEAALTAAVHRILDEAFDESREAYLLMNQLEARRFEQAHLVRGYETRTVATFHAWSPVPAASETQPAPAGEWSLIRISREPQVRVPHLRGTGSTGI
jgi:hypothetical protein